jgi:hypothetical protein
MHASASKENKSVARFECRYPYSTLNAPYDISASGQLGMNVPNPVIVGKASAHCWQRTYSQEKIDRHAVRVHVTDHQPRFRDALAR